MSYKIIGDSCCDYPYLEDDFGWLERVPLTIELDGKEYVDDKQLNCGALVNKMAATLSAPKSACPAPGAFLEAYENCDADEIYVVTLSDKLSGSYNSAVVAADIFKRSHPERKVFVFSSKSASAAQISICLKLHELAESGLDFDSVVKKTLDFISGMTTYFILETLDVFRKNGRLNHLQSLVTGALKIKMVMGGDETGNICVRGKALSIDRAIAKMADQIKERCRGRDMSDTTLYITHSQCPGRARHTRDLVLSMVGFKDCKIMKAGGISTIYANAGGMIIAY